MLILSKITKISSFNAYLYSSVRAPYNQFSNNRSIKPIIFSRSMHRIGQLKKQPMMVNTPFIMTKRFTYFNAEIKRPLDQMKKSTEDILNDIYANNPRKHPFVLKMVYKDNRNVSEVVDQSKLESLLKSRDDNLLKIYILGHLSHNDKPKKVKMEADREAFLFDIKDSDGKKGAYFFIRYNEPIEIKNPIILKIVNHRSQYLQSKGVTRRMDIMNQEKLEKLSTTETKPNKSEEPENEL